MHLMDYLNKYFPNGESGTFENSTVDLTVHFLEKFGVDIKKEDNLYLFKYNMIAAKWSLPLTHECRGTILRYDEKWKMVAYPYSKFFNFHESGLCKIQEKDFDPNLRIVEKSDGSCIQAWFDDVKLKWRCSTLGTISTQSYDQAFRPDDTFENLFLRTIQKINWTLLDTNYTYLFELCTHDNRIVTRYPKDTVYLIAVREKNYGIYKTDQEVDELCIALMENGSNIQRPLVKFFSDLNFTNFDDVKDWVEKQADNSSLGLYPEGFVIYRCGIPVAKMKNAKYLAAFHVSGGNKGHAKNAIIEAIFIGNIDDVYSMMIPELQEFSNKIKERVANLGVDVLNAGRLIANKKCPTQKDYALAVQRCCHNKQLHSFFYQNKDKVLAGLNLSELYTQWIKKSYKRFLDLWKEKEEA